jgi:hypothetical protein
MSDECSLAESDRRVVYSIIVDSILPEPVGYNFDERH